MNKSSQGFTLLEVMVALAVFAVATMAFMLAAQQYNQAIFSNQTRTLAHFVAMNTAARIQIQHQWVDGSGVTEVNEQGRRWRVKQQAYSTNLPSMQRIEIEVAPINDSGVAASTVHTLELFNIKSTGNP